MSQYRIKYLHEYEENELEADSRIPYSWTVSGSMSFLHGLKVSKEFFDEIMKEGSCSLFKADIVELNPELVGCGDFVWCMNKRDFIEDKDDHYRDALNYSRWGAAKCKESTNTFVARKKIVSINTKD